MSTDTQKFPSDDNRVVMKRNIALQIDDYRAAPEGFRARAAVEEPDLQPNHKPFFSVIIPNYNGEELLPTVISALQDQTFADFEIIVVDDASSDGSIQLLERDYPDVRLLSNGSNDGFAKSCNSGASAAYGNVLVFLNSDTEPEPEWLAELAQAICQHPTVGIFGSKVLLADKPDYLHTTGDYIRKNGIPDSRGVWERDLGQYDDYPDIFSGPGCAVAYRRELWEALGGFDEDYWMYLEDVDFAFRAQLMGIGARFVPTARVKHQLTATAGGTLSSYYVGRNTLWLIGKNMPTRLLLQNLIPIKLAQFAIAYNAMKNLRGPEARARIKGQLVGLITIPKLYRKRQIVQQNRTVEDSDLSKLFYG